MRVCDGRTNCVHNFSFTSLDKSMVFGSKYGIVGRPIWRAWMLKLVHWVLHQSVFRGSDLAGLDTLLVEGIMEGLVLDLEVVDDGG